MCVDPSAVDARRVPHAGAVLKVGLTGGIGAGKSEVARLLGSLGAHVIDADALAHAALAPGTPEFSRVVREFGPEALLPDGSLDRTTLGAIVFADPERLAALTAIVHPYVARRTAEITHRLAASGPTGAVLVHDVPLLVESQLAGNYDLVVVVDVTTETQLRRLELRGMSKQEAAARMAAQASREQRLAVADIVIDNNLGLDALALQVEQLWERLAAAAGGA